MPDHAAVSAPITADILIEADGWPDEATLQAHVDRALAAALALAAPPLADDCEVSLVFTDDVTIGALNAEYRGKDTPTNVLSFPAARVSGDVFGPLLGDIVLARETIAREADTEGTGFEDHLTHLVVHSFLHLLGYDHEEEREATVMESLETSILATLGIADPYADGDIRRPV